MEMRIVVPDRASATVLAERLTSSFGTERIRLQRQRREVNVQIDREPDSAILRVLDAVQRWLDQATVGWAEMRLGERSYRLAKWLPVGTSR